MSRIGRKPIPLPKGVAVKIEGDVVNVQGPKGKLDTQLPRGIRMEQQDGNLVAIRENDSQAAVHGLARCARFDRCLGWAGLLASKPIPLPKGVVVTLEGAVVNVQGPKGKLDTQLPRGIRVEQQDGNLVAIRGNDSRPRPRPGPRSGQQRG